MCFINQYLWAKGEKKISIFTRLQSQHKGADCYPCRMLELEMLAWESTSDDRATVYLSSALSYSSYCPSCSIGTCKSWFQCCGAFLARKWQPKISLRGSQGRQRVYLSVRCNDARFSQGKKALFYPHGSWPILAVKYCRCLLSLMHGGE